MTDYREEVPTWAYINAQISQEAVRSGDIARSVRVVEEYYGLSQESLRFINPAYVLSLLYCLIVVPKEIWSLNEKHQIYGEIDKDWFMNLFKIEFYDDQFEKQNSIYYIIHHLRNAVAHANFAIEDNGDFVFWDQKNKSLAPYFRASISTDNLQIFLSKIGSYLANLRTRGK